MASVFFFFLVVFVAALKLDLQVMHRWTSLPIFHIFPLIGATSSLRGR
jgi:hypothetical protein